MKKILGIIILLVSLLNLTAQDAQQSVIWDIQDNGNNINVLLSGKFISAPIPKYIISITNTITNYFNITNTITKTNNINLTNYVYVTNIINVTNSTSTNSVPIQTNSIIPSVYAGGNKTITSYITTLNGVIQTPTNGVTYLWSLVSGPAKIVLGNSTSLVTSITFSTNGVYDLRLTAKNGTLSGSDDAFITVNVPNTTTNIPTPTTNTTSTITNLPPVATNTIPTTNTVSTVSSNSVIFFVNKTANGLNNGSDWNNAWKEISGINWSLLNNIALNSNVIVYISGNNTYNSFIPDGNGSSDLKRIILRKANKNKDCTNAIGWNNIYDSQVVIAGGTAVSFNGKGNWLWIDGVVDSGIKIITPNSDGASISFDKANNGTKLTYLDLSGPGGSTPINMNGDNRGIDATAWNGTSYEPINNLYVGYCRIHGQVNNLWLMNVNDSIFEYNKLYDSAAANSTTYHANVCATSNSKRITWRYNEIYNHQVEGIMWIFGGAQDWYIYDNIWRDGMTGVSRILEAQDGVEGPIYFYNNTVYNVPMGIRTANGGTYATGSKARNNIYWNAAVSGFPDTANDVAFSSSATSPFIDPTNKNFNLKTQLLGGSILPNPFDKDINGKQRVAFSAGAYEF